MSQNLPTESDLRAAIPQHCFEPNLWRSLFYFLFDLTLIGLAYLGLAQTQSVWLEAALLFLIGTLWWSLFVIGHDAGHGSFSKHRTFNTVIGILAHGPLLTPYRPWQRSHALHHTKTGHLHEEEAFRAFRYEQDYAFRKLLFRSGLFLLIGWPMYKLGFRNIDVYEPVKGSHYLTTSNLYTPHIRASWLASVGVNFAFLALYVSLGVMFGWLFVMKYILIPYLIFGVWLTFVTFMQHVSPQVPVYDREDWTRVKGMLATVDRQYGPFNWLTHNIGNYHVVHHLFPTIPHYHLKDATEAIKPLLGTAYLRSDKFVLFDFVRALASCHYVEQAPGQFRWKSAYGFMSNRGRNGERAEPIQPAE